MCNDDTRAALGVKELETTSDGLEGSCLACLQNSEENNGVCPTWDKRMRAARSRDSVVRNRQCVHTKTRIMLSTFISYARVFNALYSIF